MAGESKDNLKFHIVHSVKGGCGKTTFSLTKSIDIARKYGTDKNGEAKVLYLDCDFRGSAVKALLCTRAMEHPLEFSGDEEEVVYMSSGGNAIESRRHIGLMNDGNVCTLNEFIEQKINHLEDIVVKGYTYFERDDLTEEQRQIMGSEAGAYTYGVDGRVDFIFSSSDAKDKYCFEHSMNSSSSSMMDIGIFRVRIRHLLKFLVTYGQSNGAKRKYTDIVFDMPPGTDEFANALLAELREFVRNEGSRIEVEYYNVTTADLGHLYTTEEHIAELLGGSKRLGDIQNVSCVLNELSQDEFGKKGTDVRKNKTDEIIREVKEKLRKQNLNQDIDFYINCHSKAFYTSSREFHPRHGIVFECNIEKLN